jgi:branched-chain amino acid transport system substrate-binding protein
MMESQDLLGTRPRLQDRTVSIGIAAPLSGKSERLGAEMKSAIELAIEDWNNSGGIFGARIVGRAADDAGDVATGKSAATAFCADPLVLGIVGHYNSDVSLATAAIYEACGLTTITPIASNPALTECECTHIFRFTNRDDRTGHAIARHLYRVNGKRRAIVAETSTTYGDSMAGMFCRSFAAEGGEVVQRIPVEKGRRDFGDLISALPCDFDVLFYGGSFEGAFILKAMRQQGLEQLFASGDGCWDRWNFLEIAAEEASLGEGALVLSATPELGRVAGSREFGERYERDHGPIGNYAANCYDSARFLLSAIEHAAVTAGGVPSRAEVQATMRTFRMQGIAYDHPVEWDLKGDNLAAVTALHVVENGHFRQVAEIEATAMEGGSP